MVAEESNLTVQIATLRKAIGMQWIKTVASVGYRFIPSFECPNEPPVSQPTPPMSVPAKTATNNILQIVPTDLKPWAGKTRTHSLI
jgi:DNA-binding winged helix-turn-helix (wHTH) protein